MYRFFSVCELCECVIFVNSWYNQTTSWSRTFSCSYVCGACAIHCKSTRSCDLIKMLHCLTFVRNICDSRESGVHAGAKEKEETAVWAKNRNSSRDSELWTTTLARTQLNKNGKTKNRFYESRVCVYVVLDYIQQIFELRTETAWIAVSLLFAVDHQQQHQEEEHAPRS